jgi:hypothetical protein
MVEYFAHDFQNPLHVIDSALELMPVELSEDAQNLVHAINEGMSFMSSIMNPTSTQKWHQQVDGMWVNCVVHEHEVGKEHVVFQMF